MKKILLLNPPGTKKYLRDYYCPCISKASYYYHPVDLVYLSGRLSSHFGLKVIDAIAESLSSLETQIRIKKYQPDIIIFLTSSLSLSEDQIFLKSLKQQLSKARFIGTGDVFRKFQEQSFKISPYLEAVLLDFSTQDILNYLLSKQLNHKIPNVIFKIKNKIFNGGETRESGTVYLPIPRWDLFPIEKYTLPFSRHKIYATVMTDFGCPFCCQFCPMNTLGFKLRDIGTVIDELCLLKKMGIQEIFFRDPSFGANRQRTINLCRQIIDWNLNISWTCLSRVNVVDKTMLYIMKKAGCHTVIYGIETASDAMQQLYHKNINSRQIIAAINLTQKIGINAAGTFILGLPEDTRESILKTIEFAKKLNLDYASFNVATPRVGTILEKRLMQKKIEQNLNNREIKNLQTLAVRQFYLRPKYLIKKLSKIKTLFELKQQIKEGLSLIN